MLNKLAMSQGPAVTLESPGILFIDGKGTLAEHGEKGLIDSKPCPQNPKLRTPPEIE